MTTTTTAPLRFQIHAYEDRGNHPWVHNNYVVDVPAAATVREALALFRENGASSWMNDYELVEPTVTFLTTLNLTCPLVHMKDLGLHGISLPSEVSAQRFVFPGQPRPVIPPIPDEVLNKSVVKCGLRERNLSFSISRPRGPGCTD